MPINAWLTPNQSDIEAQQDCRVISAPVELFTFINGALELLTDVDNWEQVGDVTVDEITQYFMNLIDDVQASECVDTKFFPIQPLVDLLIIDSDAELNEFQILPSAIPSSASLLMVDCLVNTNDDFEVRFRGRVATGTYTSQARQTLYSGTHRFQIFCPVDVGGCFINILAGGMATWDVEFKIGGYFGTQ